MSKQPLFQNGTSQSQRIQPALDPNYILVDERSTRDLLLFAQKHAQELRYFNEHNVVDGDWSAFLAGDVDEMVAFLQEPQRFQEDVNGASRYSRPHLLLFLSFLKLLQQAQTQMNGLTRQHLEFYYREFLKMRAKNAVPDYLYALVKLVDDQEAFLLPSGTKLHAGQDSQGIDLHYETDHDLVANQAQVANLKSVFVQKKIVGIREVDQDPYLTDLIINLSPVNKEAFKDLVGASRQIMAMLIMAYGEPNPGGKLPQFPGNRPLNRPLLDSLDSLLDFISSELYLTPSVFRTLMQLKQNQAPEQATSDTETPEWKKINDKLQDIGSKRDTGFTLDRSKPTNFEKNLLTTLGLTSFQAVFDGLPEVNDIYDLYRWRAREDVQKLIDAKLYMDLVDFEELMATVESIYSDWRQIYEILRKAGRTKHKQDPAHTFSPPEIRAYDPDKFNTLIESTLGELDFPSVKKLSIETLDSCYDELLNIESYFHMLVEDYDFIRKVFRKLDTAAPWELRQVYERFEKAHVLKRREKLKGVKERAELKEPKLREVLETLIRFALGDPEPGDNLPDNKAFDDPGIDEDYIREKLYLEPANYQIIKAIRTDANEEEWNTVYKILDQARRKKHGPQRYKAVIEQWENVYAAADATKVAAHQGLDEEIATPRWRTFGEGPEIEGTDQPVSAGIGLAIASPLLALAEGKRTITLTIGLREEQFDKVAIQKTLKEEMNPFRFFLSTQQEMIEVEKNEIKLKEPSELEITLQLAEQDPSIVPLIAEDEIHSQWPLLKILLKDINDEQNKTLTKPYAVFQALILDKVHIQVHVEGITRLTLQNDDGLLDANRPFEPFGLTPVVGSSFYMAHPEICAKKLDKLTLAIDWMGVPEKLHDYYLGYEKYNTPPDPPESPVTNNTYFKAQLAIFSNRRYYNVDDLALFEHPNATVQNSHSTTRQQLEKITGYRPNLQLISGEDVLDWSRFWRLELRNDFFHDIYPRAAFGYANRIKDGSANPFIVNLPYTPKIKRLTVGYEASIEIDPTSSGSAQADSLYHIEPFGYRPLGENAAGKHTFLPQFENEGELYIGLQNLAPPGTLSLLFQIVEGSADPDIEPEKVQWDYLSANRWHRLEAGLLSDTTNGLLNSGIILFDLPPAEANTLLPRNLYWIRAGIAKNSRSVGDMVAIHAQAVRATFVDQGNAPDHLTQALPAATVKDLVDPLPEVRAVSQPYSSMGGKGAEQPSHFYTRVSERLRHKNRALTSWDYERMVLETFPEIYKAKCLPVDTAEDPSLAGCIQLIVIPDIHGKLPFDPFEPKVPADTLQQIEAYLHKHSTPFARFLVKNPTYIRLKVRLGIRFQDDYNPAYYLQRVDQVLQRFLAPWAYKQGVDILFGGQVNESLIVNLVEELPYVDYVAHIKFYSSLDGRDYKEFSNSELASGTSRFAPDTILVSTRHHVIDVISEEGYEEEFFTGINYMKIELDFRVAPGKS